MQFKRNVVSKMFATPVYVTKPLSPDMTSMMSHLKDILSSGIWTNGGLKHAQLEQNLARHLGSGHISLFNNGTIALMVAIKALGLSGEVLVTPFTFAATPHVLSWNNITPVFVDIDPVTMTIDAARMEEAITRRTSGVLGVHVYGNPCDVVAIDSLARRHGLKVVYDAAHAFGTKLKGNHISAYGDITMFSFHATKLFHTAEGGALVTPNRALKEKIDLLKNFGIVDEATVRFVGTNGKMNEMQAAIGLCLLDIIEKEKARRLEIAEVYRTHLCQHSGITIPDRKRLTEDSLQYFCIRVDKKYAGIHRDQLYDRLKEYNIFSRKYFFPLCSSYECYSSHPSSAQSNLPNATLVSEQVLCLPFFGSLGVEGAEQICDAIKDILERA